MKEHDAGIGGGRGNDPGKAHVQEGRVVVLFEIEEQVLEQEAFSVKKDRGRCRRTLVAIGDQGIAPRYENAHVTLFDEVSVRTDRVDCSFVDRKCRLELFYFLPVVRESHIFVQIAKKSKQTNKQINK